MQRGTARKKASASTPPDMKGSWDLEIKVLEYPQLATLDCIKIAAQLRGESHDLIFGSVRSAPPTTAYALDNGEVRDGLVSFDLSIEGTVYTFTGKVGLASKGEVISNGNITPPGHQNPGGEEGSWSAQAQG